MSNRYTPEFEAEVQAWATARIPTERIPHVEGVVATVDQLAQQYAPDAINMVRLAGWLHDSAKALSDEELLQLAADYELPITPMERIVPMLLHGAVGYAVANAEFAFNNPRLESACVYHTTGAPDMTITDKIVMVGDAIEPTRKYRGVRELRLLAEEVLDEAVLQLANQTIERLTSRNRAVDPRVIELRAVLLQQNGDL